LKDKAESEKKRAAYRIKDHGSFVHGLWQLALFASES